ncbi:MAG: cobalt-precorrin-5B (C(1))-methyltransferase CbiD [Lachnospiraceae bacterium]|nr:cobalt-precorrin-5B (C(1))-methyltransferase CbiD [Lachnospiraceae bacterium]
MEKRQELKNGFTTGSCAAAAAGAAAVFLLEGRKPEYIDIETPRGDIFHAVIEEFVPLGKSRARSGVRKDGGDDPDVTTGLLIEAEVELVDINQEKQVDINRTDQNDSVDITMNTSSTECRIFIDGGKGVGRVTKPGLDRSVGEAAINSVPRRMIEDEVRRVCERNGYRGGVKILISVPGGEEIAKKTFNPRLGVVGGISILGRSGVEEPMSTRAIIDTIKAELSVHRAVGEDYVAVSPGNYGRELINTLFGYDIEKSVKCSNFIGDMLELAGDLGFKGVLLTGHIGKLVKLSGGITNTHSMNADCRMELMAAAALRAGAGAETAREILDCVSTEEALGILGRSGLLKDSMEELMGRIMNTLKRLVRDEFRVECMLLSNEYGVLAESEGAGEMLKIIMGSVQ